ncbi:hypothetical protein SAMN06297144_3295 [Sphingomonas guangdongensis]|uniref:Uncharacterized protein n=1 Tax=Sphingomonas guangdongensis TaxID=1141890 RepID=A0A285R233_9SPHN|nr:hypothetical protein SAMN06297144_3295 [Sphingomonas guangdongensis]
MASVPPRLYGMIMLAASCGSTLAHKRVFDAPPHGPAQLAEFALAMLTFTLAATGILLLIHGAALLARRTAPGGRRSDRDGPTHWSASSSQTASSFDTALCAFPRSISKGYGPARDSAVASAGRSLIEGVRRRHVVRTHPEARRSRDGDSFRTAAASWSGSSRAALSFAEAERQIYHASVEKAPVPLVPLVSFAPVSPAERVVPRALRNCFDDCSTEIGRGAVPSVGAPAAIVRLARRAARSCGPALVQDCGNTGDAA